MCSNQRPKCCLPVAACHGCAPLRCTAFGHKWKLRCGLRACRLRDSRGETEIRLSNLEKENHNLKNERRRLDNKLAQVQK